MIRRALKRIKLSPEVQEVIQASDDAEFIPAEVRPAVTKKKGADGLAKRLEKQGKAIEEPTEAEFEQSPPEPEPVVQETPEAPETPEEPEETTKKDMWEEHKLRANQLAAKIGDPIRKWYKITKPREKLLRERILAEGMTPKQVDEFWDIVESVLTPFDKSKVEQWKDSCDLDVLLRVPKKGGKDHFEAAREGAYKLKDNGAVTSSVSVEDLLQD